MQNQSHQKEPETLETVRARLAARRAAEGFVEEEDDDGVVAGAGESEVLLLGSFMKDAAAMGFLGLLPLAIALGAIFYLTGPAGYYGFLASALSVVLLWGFALLGLRHARFARRVLTLTLSLYSLQAAAMITQQWLGWRDPSLLAPLLVLGAFQTFALWQAYRRR